MEYGNDGRILVRAYFDNIIQVTNGKDVPIFTSESGIRA
jgi:hypothetical protein